MVLVLLCQVNVVMAQGILVQGNVRDAFGGMGIEQAKVQVLDSDSVIVAEAITKVPYTEVQSNGTAMSYKDPQGAALFSCEVPSAGSYTAVVRKDGYGTERMAFHVPEGQRRTLDIGDVYLFPLQNELGEAQVIATKMKMYHNGDTLVYNADAFMLDKHNVLEDLVKMLPGVELRDGKVFANGRFVESIIISGKDVMPGNPAQLMKMLPAYIVDKLKFYDQQGEKSKTMGKDMLDDRYVMDVCLKRDYHAAWLGNVEAGGGTRKRWEGLGFIMRFDDRQYFSASADANNLGREREANELCTVENTYDDQELTNRQLNLNYAYYPTEKLRFEVSGAARRQDADADVEETQKLLLSNGEDLYKMQSRVNRRTSDFYQAGMSFALRPRKGVYGQLKYCLSYGKDTEDSDTKALTSKDCVDIDEFFGWQYRPGLYQEGVTDAYTDSVHSSHRVWNHKAQAEWHWALGNHLLKLKGGFEQQMDNGDFNQRYTDCVYADGISESMNRNTQCTKVEKNKAKAQVEYNINYVELSGKRGILTPFYSYSYQNDDDRRERTIYDVLADGMDAGHEDSDNSRQIRNKMNMHTLGLVWNHEMQLSRRGWLIFNGQLPLQMREVNARISHTYSSDRQRKQYYLFSPSLEMKWYPKAGDRNGMLSSLSVKGWCAQDAPDGVNLLNQTDTSDRLNTFWGNPSLRKQTDIGLSVVVRHTFGNKQSSVYAQMVGTKTFDAWAIQSIYDSQSGKRTYQPVNTYGKHALSAECGYSIPLNSRQTFWVSLSARTGYTYSANMMLDNGDKRATDHMKVCTYRTQANVRWNTDDRNVEVAYTIAYAGNRMVSGWNTASRLQDLSNEVSVMARLPAGIKAGPLHVLVAHRIRHAVSESYHRTGRCETHQVLPQGEAGVRLERGGPLPSAQAHQFPHEWGGTYGNCGEKVCPSLCVGQPSLQLVPFPEKEMSKALDLVTNPWPKHYAMGQYGLLRCCQCESFTFKSDEYEKVETFRFGSVLPDTEWRGND